MKRVLSTRWRHVLFPEIGRRLAERRWWGNRTLPLMIWPYYVVVAWMTPRLVVIGAVGIVPAMGIFLFVVENASAQLGFALVAVLLSGIGLGGLGRPRITVRSTYPLRVESGRTFRLRYEVRNLGRRPAYDVDVDSLPFTNPMELRLKGARCEVLHGGQTVGMEGEGHARRRGRYCLPPLRWDTDFPLGIWRWGRTDWTPRHLTVFPSYERLESLTMPHGRRHRIDMQSARQLTRSALEFHGCREFRTGDTLRHVHPRSSARLGVPVVKEFQAEGRGRTALVVDTWRTLPAVLSGSMTDPVVESALSLAASIADFLARSDRVLELLVAGPGLYRFVSAGRQGFFDDVLDILAAVEPSAADPLPQLTPVLIEEIRAIESVCLVLGRWDAGRAGLVEELLARQVGVKVVLVTHGRRGLPPDLPPEVVCVSAAAVRRGEVASL